MTKGLARVGDLTFVGEEGKVRPRDSAGIWASRAPGHLGQGQGPHRQSCPEVALRPSTCMGGWFPEGIQAFWGLGGRL